MSTGSTRAWRKLRLFVLDRDHWACQVPTDAAGRIYPGGAPCGAPADAADHIVPRVLGGTDDPDNLRASCQPHNRAKSGLTDTEAAASTASATRRHRWTF